MIMMTRRQALKSAALAGAAYGAGARVLFGQAQPTPPALPAPTPSGPFKLPPLPYAPDALEPHLDAQTMQIHHDKHHAAYVGNLNKAIADFPDLGQKPVEELVRDLNTIPERIRAAVRNHGGGHANHTFFWQCLKKSSVPKPSAELAQAIDQKFGSYLAFQEQFTRAALGVFGSGWAWLCADAAKQLLLETTPNQDTPLTVGHQPLLCIDVWEHAYYLKYQNRRADYIVAFQKVINWDFAAEQFKKAMA
jgi:Fe-Mn family superoxide dismutase